MMTTVASQKECRLICYQVDQALATANTWKVLTCTHIPDGQSQIKGSDRKSSYVHFALFGPLLRTDRQVGDCCKKPFNCTNIFVRTGWHL